MKHICINLSNMLVSNYETSAVMAADKKYRNLQIFMKDQESYPFQWKFPKRGKELRKLGCNLKNIAHNQFNEDRDYFV